MAEAAPVNSRSKGNAAFKMGDLAAALDHYSRAIDEDPADALSANNASACHLKLEQWADAKRFADIALERDPKNAKAFVRRAQANVALHQSGRAVRDYRSAILLLPSHPTARNELNQVLIARSQRAKSPRLKLRVLTQMNIGMQHSGTTPPAAQLAEEEAANEELAADAEGRELLRAFRRDFERKLGVRSETAEDTGSSGESDYDESDEDEDEEAEGSDAEWETDEDDEDLAEGKTTS